MKNLDAVLSLAKKLEHIFVATADLSGTPHVAAAAQLNTASNSRVAVSAWFCPGTIANLAVNRRIALVVWDSISDRGFQLLGEVEEIEEKAMLNGYSPDTESDSPMPQVERQLLVRVDKVITFTHAPHSDLEE